MEEEISTNPFFVYFQSNKRCQQIYEDAPSKSYIVCVPVGPSLIPSKISKGLVESHVLVAASDEETEQEFKTLDGKTVHKGKSGTFETGSGFKEPRTIKVLFEETHYNEEFESFKVVCISGPLSGPVNPKYTDLMNSGDSMEEALRMAEARTIKEHRQYLRTVLDARIVKEHILASDSLRFFVQEFGFTVEKRLLRSASETATFIRDMIAVTFEDVKPHIQPFPAVSSGDGKSKPKPSKKGKSTVLEELGVRAAIECHIYAMLHVDIFDYICSMTAAKEMRVAFVIRKNKGVHLSDLNVAHILTPSDLSDAVRAMGEMNRKCTPLERIACLRKVDELLSKALFRAMNIQRNRQLSDVDDGYARPEYEEGFKRTYEMTLYDKVTVDEKPEEDTQDRRSQRTDSNWEVGVSTDDLLPFFVYVILKSQLKHLHANIMYMQKFKPDFVNRHTDVLLTHFEAALEYIEADTIMIKQALKFSYTGKETFDYLMSAENDTSLLFDEDVSDNSFSASVIKEPRLGPSIFSSNDENILFKDARDGPKSEFYQKLFQATPVKADNDTKIEKKNGDLNNTTLNVPSESALTASLKATKTNDKKQKENVTKTPSEPVEKDLLSELLANNRPASLTATEKISTKRESFAFANDEDTFEELHLDVGKSSLFRDEPTTKPKSLGQSADNDRDSEEDDFVDDMPLGPTLRQQPSVHEKSRRGSIKVNAVTLDKGSIDPLGLLG